MKFPNLEDLAIRTGEHEWCSTNTEDDPKEEYENDWEGSHRDARHDFAKVIFLYESKIPRSFVRVSLDFMASIDRRSRISHDKALPTWVRPTLRDPLSSSLRVFSNHLRQLHLWAMIDESLFWTIDGNACPWPCLELLDVMFHIARPEGGWYFQGPGDEGNVVAGFQITDEHYIPFEPSEHNYRVHDMQEEYGHMDRSIANNQLRIKPDSASLNSPLRGFAAISASVDRMKQASICTRMFWEPANVDFGDDKFNKCEMPCRGEITWSILYTAPELLNNAAGVRSLQWRVVKWCPDHELHKASCLIGQARHGEDLEETWSKEDCRCRECFTQNMLKNGTGHISWVECIKEPGRESR